MSKHSEIAKELFYKGYNCSQSVFAAFCDETGLDFDTALKLSSSFGGGMGRLREVCGALTGVFMIVGILYGYSDPEDKEAKAEHYKLIQSFASDFKDEHGSILCRELLGITTTENDPIPEARSEEYYKKRPCPDLVERAAVILDEYISKRKMEDLK